MTATTDTVVPKTAVPNAAAPYTATYTVTGMSCGHCVAAVTEELTNVAGVLGVEIDLKAKAVTVTSDQALELDLVRKAVEEAGYQFG